MKKKNPNNVRINKQFKNWSWDTKSDEKNDKLTHLKKLNKMNKNSLKHLDNAFIYIYIYRRFNAIVSQLKMHYFSGGAFESLISSQLLKKEKYI